MHQKRFPSPLCSSVTSVVRFFAKHEYEESPDRWRNPVIHGARLTLSDHSPLITIATGSFPVGILVHD